MLQLLNIETLGQITVINIVFLYICYSSQGNQKVEMRKKFEPSILFEKRKWIEKFSTFMIIPINNHKLRLSFGWVIIFVW